MRFGKRHARGIRSSRRYLATVGPACAVVFALAGSGPAATATAATATAATATAATATAATTTPPPATEEGWTAATAPVPAVNPPEAASGQAPGKVACPTTTSCYAVGGYVDAQSSPEALVEMLSGGTWHAASVALSGLNPAPAAGTAPRLSAITCASDGSCVAVGSYADVAGDTDGLILMLSGGVWTPATAPIPVQAAQTTALSAVSCPSAGQCVAVGEYSSTSGFLGLIETLNDGSWTGSTVPGAKLNLGQRNHEYLRSVSCAAVGNCVAVGTYLDGNFQNHGLIATLSDGSWAASAAPSDGLNPAPGSHDPIDMTTVRCPGTSTCFAVGFYLDASGATFSSLGMLSGGTWSVITATSAGLNPPPFGKGPFGTPSLNSLSCPTVTSCIAIGTYAGQQGGIRDFSETFSGGSWSAKTLPSAGLLPHAAGLYTTPVLSCASARSCVGVSSYQDASGFQHDLIETLANRTWTALTAPVAGLNPPVSVREGPPSLPSAGLADVACPAQDACVAVGSYADTALRPHGMIDTLGTKAAPGYWLATSTGNVYGFHAPSYQHVTIPGKTIAMAGDGPGYLLASSSGTVTSINAPYFGSPGGKLAAPVTGIAVDAATGGYWLTTSKGRIYAFNAPDYGSLAARRLKSPIVGIAADGSGYLLISKAGNVYNFGTRFRGSLAGKKLPAPIAGIAADRATGGYWLVSSKGRVYPFDAPALGSVKRVPSPITVIVTDGDGYLLVSAAGNVHAFATQWYGSLARTKLPAPVAAASADG